MSNYRLVDHGYPFKKIMHGKKWIGRVYKHADGTYRGAIGKIELGKGATATEAFSEAVARFLGFKSAAELDQHNREVRASNREKKARMQGMFDGYLRAKTHQERMDAFDKIFDGILGEEK